jgi:hypothetical protein
LDGAREVGQVLVDGGLQDGVCGVEVAVGEVVSHPGDLLPGDGWLGVEQVTGQCLDRFADFQLRIASKIRPSDRSPRCRWERIASMAAWMSASRWRSR